MKRGFATLLIVAIVFGAGYWYYTVEAVCDVPLAYRIGAVDPRFGITYEEARASVSAAESLWEDATGRNLFTHDESADFSINFIFDERQAEADAEEHLREELEEREGLSDTVKEQYEYLLQEYNELKISYEMRSAAYEEELKVYNREVARWNSAGGAPSEVFEELEAQQEVLGAEQQALNGLAYDLNQLVRKMNAIGDEGNDLIADYNEIVEEYNTRFNEEREFTQGDYQGDSINIYQFDSREELEIVLAHEFGHALSLGHVEGEASIMYHFMGAQTLEEGLTFHDTDEFDRVCGKSRFTLWSVL